MKNLFLMTFLLLSATFFAQDANYSFCGLSSANDAALTNIGEKAKTDSNIVSLKYIISKKLLVAQFKDNPKRKKEFDLFSWMQNNDIELFIYRKMVRKEFIPDLLANNELKNLK
jgi:diketogulonate reductase-like aldo/keto reductase